MHHFSRTYYEHQDFLESLNADEAPAETTDEPTPGETQTTDETTGEESRDENTQTP